MPGKGYWLKEVDQVVVEPLPSYRRCEEVLEDIQVEPLLQRFKPFSYYTSKFVHFGTITMQRLRHMQMYETLIAAKIDL